MRKKILLVLLSLLSSVLLNPQASYAYEKLGSPFDVKVAAAKKGELGVPINVSAGLTIKKVKKKWVSTYHPINVTVTDFKVYDTNYEYRGEAIGYVPRFGYTVTVKNFSNCVSWAVKSTPGNYCITISTVKIVAAWLPYTINWTVTSYM